MRRILIISTTFFPDPAVPAIRMTQWCRHLPNLGWKPHVLCRYYGFEASPEELAAKVHPEVTVEYLDKPVVTGGAGRASNSPGGLKALARKLVNPLLANQAIATLFVPDPSILFWRRQRQHILKRVQEIRPDVILTTSPPHSNHDIGLWLAAQTGIPWVADFRDPYLLDNRFKPSGIGLLRWRAHARFKDEIYRRAWLVTQAIPNQARWARRYMPSARGRLLTLTNGYPAELLEELAAARSTATPRKTVLVTGTIPEPEQLQLAQAVARLAAEGHDVQLKLVGKRPVIEPRLREVLGDRLVLTGYVSYRESIREVARADVLVSFLDEFRSQCRLLSTKLFEYLASGQPVVCINPSRADRLLLWRMISVTVLKQPALAEIVATLRRALEGGSYRDPAELERFRREFRWPIRVAQLAPALDQLVTFPPMAVEAPAATPVASVVIPTRNRKQLLEKSIRSAFAQSVPVEVIVMDDGSTDGTADMLRRDFPQVRYHAFGGGKGPSFLRNRGIELAGSPIVFPIDDDSVFSSPRVVEQTLKEFDHPRVAAVGIPYLNPRLDWTLLQHSPSIVGCQVAHAFVGAAHAMRREVFLKMGGYREHFFYMGEEGDLCLRMMLAGHVTRLGQADPIHHLESPLRNLSRAGFFGRRNDILFCWHNVPMPYLPLHLLGTTVNGLRSAASSGCFWPMLRGMASGYADCFHRWNERRPVSPEIYRLHRTLKKHGPRLLSDIEQQLPPLSSEL